MLQLPAADSGTANAHAVTSSECALEQKGYPSADVNLSQDGIC